MYMAPVQYSRSLWACSGCLREHLSETLKCVVRAGFFHRICFAAIFRKSIYQPIVCWRSLKVAPCPGTRGASIFLLEFLKLAKIKNSPISFVINTKNECCQREILLGLKLWGDDVYFKDPDVSLQGLSITEKQPHPWVKNDNIFYYQGTEPLLQYEIADHTGWLQKLTFIKWTINVIYSYCWKG